jgi:peptidoglycan/xylan/chitin deacetylase (PgdA/CDA1 family)
VKRASRVCFLALLSVVWLWATTAGAAEGAEPGLKPLPSFPQGGIEPVKTKPTYTPRPPRAKSTPAVAAPAMTTPRSTSQGAPAASIQNTSYVHNGPSWSNGVALTFDDGPSATYTPPILRYLRDNHVPATFFLLGENVEKRPSIVIEMAEYGFEIGNHTWSHVNLASAPKEQIERQIGNASDVIERVCGKRPTLFRPPECAVGKAMREVCVARGLSIIIWSLDTNDWRSGRTTAQILQAVASEVKGGSIILLHDRFARTVEAVPLIVEAVRERGLEFVTVSDLLRQLRSPKPAPTAAPALGPSEPAGPRSASSKETSP